MSQEPPPEAGPAETTAPAAGGRFGDVNPLYVLFGALAGIVVLALVWFAIVAPLLGGDEEGTDEVAQPTPVVTTEPGPGTTPDEQPPTVDEDVDLPMETFEVFLARDPFRPVRPQPVGGPDGTPGDPGTAPGDGAVPPGDGTTQPPGDGTGQPPGNGLPPTDGGTPPPSDGGAGGQQPPKEDDREDRATVEGREVELIDIVVENGRRRVVVRVDDESFTVEPGETFADRFRLLSIDGSCATFLYGDNRFTLCEGERVLK